MEEVYLLEYSTWGHHSLAFFRDGELVEFTYGDWELFALNQRDGWTAWKNMTFCTQGALGRKSVPGTAGETIRSKFKECERAAPFLAPATRVADLHERLQRAYDSRAETEVFNRDEAVRFVKYDTPYWAFHNCNHELADWLEQPGGEISRIVFFEPELIEGMRDRRASESTSPGA